MPPPGYDLRKCDEDTVERLCAAQHKAALTKALIEALTEAQRRPPVLDKTQA